MRMALMTFSQEVIILFTLLLILMLRDQLTRNPLERPRMRRSRHLSLAQFNKKESNDDSTNRLLRTRRALSLFSDDLLRTRRALSLFSDDPLRTRRALSLFNDVPLRTRRALSLFNDVPLRTRRALSLYKVHGDSTLLVHNGTSLTPFWFSADKM